MFADYTSVDSHARNVGNTCRRFDPRTVVSDVRVQLLTSGLDFITTTSRELSLNDGLISEQIKLASRESERPRLLAR
jgi:hypothetical protein